MRFVPCTITLEGKGVDNQKMASSSFGLFVQQLQASDDELRVQIVYIIYDLLILHDNNKLVAGTIDVSADVL